MEFVIVHYMELMHNNRRNFWSIYVSLSPSDGFSKLSAFLSLRHF